MAFEFKLPDIGEGVVEGEVVRWLVKEGDAIAEDQPMVEVMTDKATVEIPSPKAGRVARLMFDVGAKAPVGATLIVIETADGGSAAKPGASARAAPAPTPSALPTATPSPRPEAGKALATPAIRQYAREKGVDLSTVTPTGPGGRVTKEDVDRALGVAGRAPAVATHATATAQKQESDQRIPFVGLRRKIAENMARSKQTAAHFTYVEEADVTDLVRLREKAKASFAERGVALSYLPFVVKAVVAGLKKHPMLNATLDEARSEIVLRKSAHLGIAVATDKGLVVPVLRDADRKSLLEIARELQALGEKAKTGQLLVSDFGGSTFTLTSLGQLGGVLATPIINFPEVAILGVHKIRPRPAVVGGQIVIRDLMNLSISLDHRIVDGYEGAQFLAEVVKLLENPQSLIEPVATA
ncbi:MAG: dihydrolipoamide acetyltransferase family protein [Myxococcota bacterium]